MCRPLALRTVSGGFVLPADPSRRLCAGFVPLASSLALTVEGSVSDSGRLKLCSFQITALEILYSIKTQGVLFGLYNESELRAHAPPRARPAAPDPLLQHP